MGRGDTETELVFDNYSVKFCGFSVRVFGIRLPTGACERFDVFLVLHSDFTISLSYNTPIRQTSGTGNGNEHLSWHSFHSLQWQGCCDFKLNYQNQKQDLQFFGSVFSLLPPTCVHPNWGKKKSSKTMGWLVLEVILRVSFICLGRGFTHGGRTEMKWTMQEILLLFVWKDSFLWTDLGNRTLHQTEFLFFVYCWNPEGWYFLNFQFFIFCEMYLNLPNSNTRREPPFFKKTLFVCHCVSCLQELMSLYRLLWYSDYGNRQKYYQVWIQLNRVHFPQQEWVKKNSLSIHSFRQMHYILLIKANKCTCSCYVEI